MKTCFHFGMIHQPFWMLLWWPTIIGNWLMPSSSQRLKGAAAICDSDLPLRSKEIARKKAAAAAKRSFWENLVASDQGISAEVKETALGDLYKLIGYDGAPKGDDELPLNAKLAHITIQVAAIGFRYVRFSVCAHQPGSFKTWDLWWNRNSQAWCLRSRFILDQPKSESLVNQLLSMIFSLSQGEFSLSLVWIQKIEISPKRWMALLSWLMSQGGHIQPMIQLNLAVTPADAVADLVMGVRTQPVLVVFSRPLIDKLVKFFAQGEEQSEIEKFLEANANLETMQRTVQDYEFCSDNVRSKPKLDMPW